jgi:hypothetical protein
VSERRPTSGEGDLRALKMIDEAHADSKEIDGGEEPERSRRRML